MTISESLAFARTFSAAVGDLVESMTVVLCPPCTALYALSAALSRGSFQLGAQDLCPEPGKAHTGQISGALLADAGCEWVLLGHWEVRHRTGETDAQVNKKIHAAFESRLRPIILVGEGRSERKQLEKILTLRLPHLFERCEPEQVALIGLIYEPEWAIGAEKPAPPEAVVAGCGFIRTWISQAYGVDIAQKVHIVYGGSVTPKNAQKLLASNDIDGLGAGRKGRDPIAFAQIVRLIAETKGLSPVLHKPQG